MTRSKIVVITQNASLLREALEGQKFYRKICKNCGVGVRAITRAKRKCPACGGALRAATQAEKETDTFCG